MTDTFAGLTPPYGTIIADPPWQYRPGARTAELRSQGRGKQAEDHYGTMTMHELAALPVADLAAPQSHCYIWTTGPRLFGDRFDRSCNPGMIMEAWGFDYITTIVWHKTGGNGMGWYWRVDTEFLLFGVRGKAPIPAEVRRSNHFTAAKSGHSVKPQSVLDAIEIASPGPRLELFARSPRLGWDSWGRGYE